MESHTGWPVDVIEPARRAALACINRPSTVAFKIGRTNNLGARQDEYRAEYGERVWLYALYETTSLNHAKTVERALIEALGRHPKSVNRARHTGGGENPDSMQCVYLAMGADLAR